MLTIYCTTTFIGNYVWQEISHLGSKHKWVYKNNYVIIAPPTVIISHTSYYNTIQILKHKVMCQYYIPYQIVWYPSSPALWNILWFYGDYTLLPIVEECYHPAYTIQQYSEQ